MIKAKLNWFIISDLHFDHENIIRYCRPDFINKFTGAPDHRLMVQRLIENWNRVVGKNDKVLIVGDVCMNSKTADEYLEELNGQKYLVMGNHDTEKHFVHGMSENGIGLVNLVEIDAYAEVKVKDGKGISQRIIISHIPIHPACMERWVTNIHGHTHTHNINNFNAWETQFPGQGAPDARYINVSCEQLNYTPVRIGDLFKYENPEGV